MKWKSSAPSNIALIKYMGKTDVSENRPSNPSLSYTLNHLQTTVELELSEGTGDTWEPLDEMKLSEKAQQRFLKHLDFLKKEFQFSGAFVVRSKNNFPASCGLASSASSFAALTLCAEKAIRELKQGDLPKLTRQELSFLSQCGSGSSCRSLFPSWSMWEDRGAKEITVPFEKLHHQVVVVDQKEKEVSSSEAHRRVTGSLLFEGRVHRAKKRLENLRESFEQKDWTAAYETVWSEFWDMHALFETSHPSFTYLTSSSIAALNVARECWKNEGDGPLVTMDAGPNIHLLYREDQIEQAQSLGRKLTEMKLQVIASYDER